jgi:DnaJ-class molecular chaperone
VDGHGPGDLYVAIHVVIPKHLSREQRQLIEVLSRSLRLDNKPLERRVAEKVKDFVG